MSLSLAEAEKIHVVLRGRGEKTEAPEDGTTGASTSTSPEKVKENPKATPHSTSFRRTTWGFRAETRILPTLVNTEASRTATIPA
jgi:hypothetical protein